MRFKRILFPFLSIALCSFLSTDSSFRKEQKKHEKVKTAYTEKWSSLKTELLKNEIDTSKFILFIRIFKKEQQVEAWLASKGSGTYKKFKTFKICSSSGVLGPKRKQGDGQVPEGFYTVSVFNPYSNYYLSLGVSYPNQSDRILGGKGDLGGAIMIHGNCVTIGCIPITDDKIKELYVLAVEAKSNGQANIPIHIFPARLSAENMKVLEGAYETDKTMISFWKNLETGYTYFEDKKKLPTVSVAKDGKYQFN